MVYLKENPKWLTPKRPSSPLFIEEKRWLSTLNELVIYYLLSKGKKDKIPLKFTLTSFELCPFLCTVNGSNH